MSTTTENLSPASSSVSVPVAPVRAAVIGLGRIGWDHHAKTIISHPGFELSAVCDIDAKRTEEAHILSVCAQYQSVPDLVADPNVELVIVASQSIDHEPMTLKALEAGKHVLCEKPAALSSKGVQRMIDAANQSGVKFTVHHNYRVAGEFLYIRETIASGILGEVVRVKRRNVGFGRRNDWQVLKKYGGGMTGNWGIHLVDQCLCLADSPIRDVWGDVKQVFNPGDAEDDIKAIVRLESGLTLDIDMSSVNAAPEPSWVIMGSTGTLWIIGGECHLQFFDPKELPSIEVNDGTQAVGRRYGVVSDAPTEIPWQRRTEKPNPTGTYPSFYDNLLSAIRYGAELIVTPESALQTYQVLDEVRQGTRFAPED